MLIETTYTEAQELDARSGDGIDVQLLWHPVDDTVSVFVYDATHRTAFEIAVDRQHALDAFHHPFAYAASHGVPFEVPHRAHHEPQTIA